jgi:hypothetical protein
VSPKHSGLEVKQSQARAEELRPSVEVLTIAEAVRRCNTSDDTLRRRLAEGEFESAFQDSSRRNAWFIPVADLYKAGFFVKDAEPTQRRLGG